MNFPRWGENPEIPAQRADGLGGPRKIFQRDRDQRQLGYTSCGYEWWPAVYTVDFDGSPALPRSKSMISRYTDP